MWIGSLRTSADQRTLLSACRGPYSYIAAPRVTVMDGPRKAGFLLEMTTEQRTQLHATAAAAGMSTRAYVLSRLGMTPAAKVRPGRKVHRQDALPDADDGWQMAG